VASDYFIYFSANKGIVIDLFYAQDMHSLGGVVNIKLKRYSSLPFKTIFILVGNELIDIDTIRKYLSRRKVPIPFNILVDTENNFKVSTINQLKALSIYSR
jgi:SAM-dependent MidA family methyltransferase